MYLLGFADTATVFAGAASTVTEGTETTPCEPFLVTKGDEVTALVDRAPSSVICDKYS